MRFGNFRNGILKKIALKSRFLIFVEGQGCVVCILQDIIIFGFFWREEGGEGNKQSIVTNEEREKERERDRVTINIG